MRAQACGNVGVDKGKGLSGVGELPDWESLFSELIQQQESHTGELSMVEWEEMTGYGKTYLTKRFHAAKKAGRLVVTTVKRESLDGRMFRCPAYQILPAKKV